MLRCETVPRQHILTQLDAAALSGSWVLVKSATVGPVASSGLRALLARHSPAGRPRADREIRRLIRHMSSANPLWGAPRIPEPFPWDIAPDAERGFTRDKAGYVDLL